MHNKMVAFNNLCLKTLYYSHKKHQFFLIQSIRILCFFIYFHKQNTLAFHEQEKNNHRTLAYTLYQAFLEL
jgi:hypothetical protein